MDQPRRTAFAILISIVSLLASSVAAQDAPLSTLVTGTVRSEVGQPLAGVEVTVIPGPAAKAVSDAQGTFRLQLAPGTYEATAQLAGFEPVTEQLVVREGEGGLLAFTLGVAETILAEINVAASYGIDRTEPVATGALTSEEVLALPRLGNDLLRGIRAIPGVTASEVTAQFNVRGGLYRDAAIRIDGLEIYEPYHVKDFDNGIFSIIDPEVIGSLDLIPGGFPAEYGDKMAGVLDLTTARPSSELSGHLGVSILSFWAGAAGSLGAGDETRWRVSARYGVIEFVNGDEEEEDEVRTASGPRYWDLIGRVEHSFSPANVLSVSALLSRDSLEEEETELDDFGDPESDTIDSEYENSYLWLNHEVAINDSMFVHTVLSTGRVEDDRRATEEGVGANAAIRDLRAMDIISLRQDWSFQLSPKHYLKWGGEARSYDVSYDYTNDFAFDGVLGSEGLTRFMDSFSAESQALYFADRLRIGDALVLELGARYDRQTHTDEDQLSPRLNLVYDLGRAGTLRASAGHYHQSQRPNELQVEDGESAFFPAERADTLSLGWERSFGSYNLRIDAYNRDVNSPRPYYDNIFETTNPNPEATRDRILIAPESSNARGLEIFASRRGVGSFNWWGSYTWSEVTDRIDGRDIPRSYDQTHAVSLSGTYPISPKWTITGLFNYHTGWPTTAVSGRAVVGPEGAVEIEPVLGDLRAERLDDYHRLDVRVSRFVEFASGNSLEFFLDVQNVYARENIAGFLVDDRNFALLPSGEVEYVEITEESFPVVPSFGVGFSF
jgi:outer membrane cobalamin receptor